jgi:hypothetical protein
MSGADTAAPAGPRVFVCGHSFMIFTAQLLPPLAQAAHLPYVSAGSQMLGGSRVIQHWDLPDERNPAKTALRNGRVDVLTLSPHVLLPDPGIDPFAKLGLAANPRLRVLVQASWPARDGVKDRAFHNVQRNASTVASLRRMQEAHRKLWLDKLEAQVRALNQALGRDAVFIIPVSDAVFALRERIAEGKAPGLTEQTDLFLDDLGHPQLPLAELVTYCHFAAIYQRSPVGLPVPEKLQGHAQAPELNRLLQQLAWDAVKNHPLGGVPSGARAGAAPATGAAPKAGSNS